MDASGLFTVLGIFIAIITLISEERRQDFFLRVSWIDTLCFFVFNLIALVVIYSSVVIEVFNMEGINYIWGFDDKTVVLTCVILMSLIFVLKLRSKRLPISNYGEWGEFSYKLLKDKKYNILNFLFEKYLDQFLFEIDRQGLYENFHKFIRVNSQLRYEEILNISSIKISKFRKFKFFVFSRILLYMPKEISGKTNLINSISRLIKSSGFLNYLVDVHSTIPIKLTSLNCFLRIEEFVDGFFKLLISNENSLLYRELKDNQGFLYSKGFDILPENFLLNYYFSNTDVAIKVMLWQPIGDYLCEFIRSQNGKNNYYNSYCNNFYSTDERWNCKIYVGIYFFNFMVSSSIYQKKDDHMSLNYYNNFLDEILNNIDRSENSETWQENPLKFDYLINVMVNYCCDWVLASNTLLADQNDKIVAIDFASNCLGEMLRKILLSKKVDEKQKIIYLNKVLKTMSLLDVKNEKLSLNIFNSLVGVTLSSKADSDITWLKRIYLESDFDLRSKDSVFNIELYKILKKAL